MMKKITFIIALFICFISFAYSSDKDKLIEFQAQKFKYMLEVASQNYPDSLDITAISDKAFAALMQAVDKESFYYNKPNMKLVTESNKGVSYGIGAELVSVRDSLYIIQIFPNTPAYEANLEVGDIVLSVDGRSTLKMMKVDADKLVSGDSTTSVTLEIKNVISEKIRKVKLIRKDVPNRSLTTAYFYPKSDIGIFVLNRFSAKAAEEFRHKAELFISLGMKRLIIDVRNNPGGFMVMVDEILDMLISGNRLLTKVVSGNKEFNSEVYSMNGGFLEKIPVVVVVDENSASGSELLAGVVQDYDRGIVVGKRSYGKGSIQRIWSMNDSTGFKLTVGKYLTPSGRDIQKKAGENISIEPTLDTNIKFDDIQNQINKLGGIAEVKIYKSTSGRPIIGGGGVTPDYFVDADTLTQLTNLLIRKGLYFEWAISYKKKHGKELKEKYGNDYSKFNLDFQINDEMLREFANFALQNKVWNNEMFTADKSYFINYMKASIANVIWGYDAFSEVMCIVDKQITAAIKKLPEAEQMIYK